LIAWMMRVSITPARSTPMMRVATGDKFAIMSVALLEILVTKSDGSSGIFIF